MHKLPFYLLQKKFSTWKDRRKKEKEPFLSCLVTYLLLLGNVINISLLRTNLGAQPCKEGSSRHVGNISIWHWSWSRDLPVIQIQHWHIGTAEKWSLTFLTQLAILCTSAWRKRHSKKICYLLSMTLNFQGQESRKNTYISSQCNDLFY